MQTTTELHKPNSAYLNDCMEQVYRYVPSLGWRRAIHEVASYGDDTDYELREILTERYEREMREFTEQGGY